MKKLLLLTILITGYIQSNPLHDAAERGDLAAVKILVEEDNYNPNEQNNYVWTALHYAAIYGHKDVAYLLEQSKYPINSNLQDYLGKTALHETTDKGHKEVIKSLLYYGANIAMCDFIGNYPFDYATDPEIKKLLTPSNPEEFRKNPNEYKRMHPLEFDPVNRFPEEFIDFDKRTLEKKLKNQNTTNTAAYLFNRSIGATNVKGNLVSNLMNP